MIDVNDGARLAVMLAMVLATAGVVKLVFAGFTHAAGRLREGINLLDMYLRGAQLIMQGVLVVVVAMVMGQGLIGEQPSIALITTMAALVVAVALIRDIGGVISAQRHRGRQTDASAARTVEQ